MEREIQVTCTDNTLPTLTKSHKQCNQHLIFKIG